MTIHLLRRSSPYSLPSVRLLLVVLLVLAQLGGAHSAQRGSSPDSEGDAPAATLVEAPAVSECAGVSTRHDTDTAADACCGGATCHGCLGLFTTFPRVDEPARPVQPVRSITGHPDHTPDTPFRPPIHPV